MIFRREGRLGKNYYVCFPSGGGGGKMTKTGGWRGDAVKKEKS